MLVDYASQSDQLNGVPIDIYMKKNYPFEGFCLCELTGNAIH